MLNEVKRLMPRKRTKLPAPKKPYVPASDDRITELRNLIKLHAAYTSRSVSFESALSDKKNRATGEKIPCLIPVDDRHDGLEVAKAFGRKAAALESNIARCLQGHPVWEQFLKTTYGFGPVVAGYIIARVDIRTAVKPSQLRRYCGYAAINGRLERPVAGQKLGYNKHLRTRIHQAFSACVKNCGRYYNGETKYSRIYRDVRARLVHSPLYNEHDNTWDGAKGGKAHINSAARNKAISVFLDDLYMFWRAAEGLPVWPKFYEAKLGYAHNSDRIVLSAPKVMTVDEALELIGDRSLRATDGLPLHAKPKKQKDVEIDEAAQ